MFAFRQINVFFFLVFRRKWGCMLFANVPMEKHWKVVGWRWAKNKYNVFTSFGSLIGLNFFLFFFLWNMLFFCAMSPISRQNWLRTLNVDRRSCVCYQVRRTGRPEGVVRFSASQKLQHLHPRWDFIHFFQLHLASTWSTPLLEHKLPEKRLLQISIQQDKIAPHCQTMMNVQYRSSMRGASEEF